MFAHFHTLITNEISKKIMYKKVNKNERKGGLCVVILGKHRNISAKPAKHKGSECKFLLNFALMWLMSMYLLYNLFPIFLVKRM